MKKIFNIVVNDNDETGMNFISFVDYPAVEYDFLKFEKEKPLQLQFNGSKHIVSGVVALADVPIYRYTPSMGEYWVVFTKEVIEKMVLKYSKHNLNNSVDLQHNGKAVDGVIMVESFIVNKERGICPTEFNDITDGSWIASFKVENEDVWNEIIKGESLNGFSLSGLFRMDEVKEPDEIDNLINEILG